MYEKLFNLPSVLLSLLMTVCTMFLGGYDNIIHATLFMMVADYVGAVIGAFYSKTLSSRIGFKGFLKKCGMILIIAVGVELNKLLPDAPIREIICYFYIVNEGISICETICKYTPVPDSLKEFFLQLRSDDK